MVDRSDVPQLYDHAFLYGHARVTDITNGNNTVVAEDVFTHVIVAHVMDENAFYSSLKGSAASPTMVCILICRFLLVHVLSSHNTGSFGGPRTIQSNPG